MFQKEANLLHLAIENNVNTFKYIDLAKETIKNYEELNELLDQRN